MPKGQSISYQDILSIMEIKGFSKEKFLELYNDNRNTRNAIAKEVNSIVGDSVLHPRRVEKFVLFCGGTIRTESDWIQAKNKAISDGHNNDDPDKKTYGNNQEYSENDILKLYSGGLSIAQIYRDTGVSYVVTANVLKKNGVQTRKQLEWSEVKKRLHEVGFERDDIVDYYITQGNSKKSLADLINTKIGVKPGGKTMNTLLEKLDIYKTEEQIKYSQGNRGRRTKEVYLSRLKRAGFNSLQELADYYEKNKKVTQESLVKQLNDPLGETYFTTKWLERNMIPLLSEDRLRGSSRLELNIREYLKTIYTGPVVYSSRKIAAPYEVDIYFPEKKLAIEVNGDYWHSDKFMLDNKGLTAEEYHLLKSDKCSKAGVQLVYIWESDWVNKNELVCSALERLINLGMISPVLMKI